MHGMQSNIIISHPPNIFALDGNKEAKDATKKEMRWDEEK